MCHDTCLSYCTPFFSFVKRKNNASSIVLFPHKLKFLCVTARSGLISAPLCAILKREANLPQGKVGVAVPGEELRAHYDRYRAVLSELTLMSDAFMRNVLKVTACAEYVLQVILGKKDLRVTEVIVQQDNKNLQGRSAVLDCVARDDDDIRYNVEIQQENEGASPKRARFHSGLLDMNTLNPGEDFDKLQESYVIFITRNDVLKAGLPIYHIERRIKETGRSFPDQSHIIYVTSSIQEDTELGRLMHDFHCKSADDMYSRVLADRVRTLKETPKGVESMCRELEKIYLDGRTDGRAEGVIKATQASIKNLMETLGLSLEAAMAALKIPQNEWQTYSELLKQQ